MPDPWRLARVRFWESGRAGQTPSALLWEDAWLPVRLLSESRVEGPRSGGPQERRFLVQDAGGVCYEIRGRGGSWRTRRVNAAPQG